jgi:hypothetical protein
MRDVVAGFAERQQCRVVAGAADVVDGGCRPAAHGAEAVLPLDDLGAGAAPWPSELPAAGEPELKPATGVLRAVGPAGGHELGAASPQAGLHSHGLVLGGVRAPACSAVGRAVRGPAVVVAVRTPGRAGGWSHWQLSELFSAIASPP